MKKLLLVLVPWMAISVAYAQKTRPAEVVYTHLGRFHSGFERAGNECLATLKSLEQLGWKVETFGESADIEVDSQKIHVRLARNSDGDRVVRMSECATLLKADLEWADNDTLVVSAKVLKVEVKPYSFNIVTSLEAWPKIQRRNREDQMIIDLEGVHVDEKSNFKLPNTLRLNQVRGNVLRITLDAAGVARISTPELAVSDRFSISTYPVELKQQDNNANPETKTQATRVIGPTIVKTAPPVKKPVPPPQATPQVSTAEPIGISPAKLVPQNNGDLLVVFPISSRLSYVPSSTYLDPSTIQLSVANSYPISSKGSETASNLIRTIDLSRDLRGGTTLKIAASQAVGVQVSTSAREIQVLLVKPKFSNPKLAGKVIVVDAGHGGSDQGTRSPDRSLLEKNITLSIARKLAAELAEEGAQVIMTRNDDVFIELSERANIANRSNADLFVSVHINSNRVNSRSGILIFYHGGSALGKSFAECINHEVTGVTAIPALGSISDKTVAKTKGFSVLRNSNMPSVLCELGFLDHDHDRPIMITNDFQDEISKAIVKGIKVFLGDATNSK